MWGGWTLTLVLQDAAIGESGQVLVLDMGEPVRIVDLARDLIRLSRHSVEEIPIVFSGRRPSEKLFEELLADSDATLPTRIARLRIAKLGTQGQSIVGLLRWAAATAVQGDAFEVRKWLGQALTELRAADADGVFGVPADPG